MSTQTRTGQRVTSGVLLSRSPPCALRHALSDPELTGSPGLPIGKPPPSIYMRAPNPNLVSALFPSAVSPEPSSQADSFINSAAVKNTPILL